MDIDELRERAIRAGFTVSATDSVSRRAAAHLLKRTVKTLANWASMGAGPDQEEGGRSRYTLASLELFIASHVDHRRRGEKKFSRLSRMQKEAA